MDATCPRGDQEWQPDRLDMLLSAVRIVDVNDEAIRLFGLPADRDKVLDRPTASVWPEQSRAALGDLLTTIAASAHKGTVAREIPTVGRLQHVVLTGWRAFDPRCADTVFVSVRATLNAPNAVIELEASQKRYRNLISSLPIPVWQIDARPAGRIFDRLRASGITDMAAYSDEHPEIVKLTCEIVQVFDVNKEAMVLFGGKHRSEFIGSVKYLFSTTPGATKRVMLAHFSGVRNHVEELKVRTFDGRLLDVLLLMTFPVPGERLDTTILMMIDNTARLEAEAKLRKIEADFSHAARLSTLGEMTTSIAHEIKQPLSAILMNAQTSLRYLRRAEPNLDKVDVLTSRVVESAQRAGDIIGRIQDMAGKREATSTLLDFNDVVRQCVVFLRHESEDKDVVIMTKLQQDLPAVRGDRIQLQQVIVNLIVNSIQAMKKARQMQREIYLETRLRRERSCRILDQRYRDWYPGGSFGSDIRWILYNKRRRAGHRTGHMPVNHQSSRWGDSCFKPSGRRSHVRFLDADKMCRQGSIPKWAVARQLPSGTGRHSPSYNLISCRNRALSSSHR